MLFILNSHHFLKMSLIKKIMNKPTFREIKGIKAAITQKCNPSKLPFIDPFKFSKTHLQSRRMVEIALVQKENAHTSRNLKIESSVSSCGSAH